MQYNKASGFTLIELLIAIAIISLLGLSMPSLSKLIIRQRMASSQSELRLLISRARMEALNLRQRITLCPLNPSGHCTTAWEGVLSVFIDSNGNRQQDAGELLLYVMQLDPTIKLQWRGMNPANSLHFSTQGVTFVSNGTFSLCHSAYNETYRLIVNRQGRTRTERIFQDCNGKPTT